MSEIRKIEKVLVANRGEIALRVMRTCKDMGIRTVAIFSDADRGAKYVQYADQAVHIGPPASAQSYLQGQRIVEVALRLGVDAIHPGYGFLSENARFAEQVMAAGLAWIGPEPHAIRVMGDKLTAKNTVKAHDIPMVPGVDHAVTSVEEGKQVAERVGYPVLIKASAGGGGKGMRIVEREADFEEQMRRAVSEALSAFGDGAVFIERYVGSPHHIEVQVLADKHGNCVHLFERECSIQRRHQKVVEEAPSPLLTPELRQRIGQAAVRVARSCQYVGAGTVEFLMDENRDFYFLEMNTRLQVEHPVTEMVTGIDLVREQIRVAQGHPLSFRQEDLSLRGHAIELRVYAEDPMNDFMPNVGVIRRYNPPKGPGIRVDDGYEAGMEIPIHYDSMIAKLVVHGRDRAEAIERMLRAIDDYVLTGLRTTLPFGSFVMRHPAFRAGLYDTHFVGDHFDPRLLEEPKKDAAVAAVVAARLFSRMTHEQAASHPQPRQSSWRRRG